MNRRSFLKAGLHGTAFSLAALSSRHALAAAFSAGGREPVGMVVADTRIPASIQFAHEASRVGLKPHRINGDVTALWYRHLDQLWRERSVVVAGLTPSRPIFALEQMARDRHVRLTMSVEHRPQPDGSIQHLINAPAGEERALKLILEQENWHQMLAHYFRSGVPSGSGESRRQYSHLLSASAGRTPLEQPLTSWVLAPV